MSDRFYRQASDAAEIAAGSALDVGGLAKVLAAHLDGPCDDPRCHLLGRRNVGPLSEHLAEAVAAHVEALREADRAAVLNEAADALEGRLGTDGAPRDLYEFRLWLRDRAAEATQ